MRSLKRLSVVLILLAAGCVTSESQLTSTLKPQDRLIEGVSCQIPATTSIDYNFKAKQDKYGRNDQAKTDYFKLAINYSPTFCDSKRRSIEQLKYKNKANKAQQEYKKFELQCFSDNKFGWIVHGLWAQTCDGKSMEQCRDWSDISKHPRLCRGDLAPVDYSLLKPYLCASPGADLLQGEWEKHGACDFEQPQQYFAKQQALFNSLVLPADRLPNKQLIEFLQQYNPQLKNKHIQINRDEFYICYSTDFKVIDCPAREH